MVKQRISLKLGQNLYLSQGLQQAIKLLQLSAVELEHEVQEMLERNALLEADYTPSTNELNAFPSFGDNYLTTANHGTSTTDVIENLCASEENLRSYLYWQISLLKWPKEYHQIAYTIIENIQDDGFLSCGIEEIIMSLPPKLRKPTLVHEILWNIQRLDPVGIACLTLQQSLLIQLENKHCTDRINYLTSEVIKKHLGTLANKEYQKLKDALSASDEDILDIIEILMSLKSSPGHLFSNSTKTTYVIPDLTAYVENEAWCVKLNDELNTKVKINSEYQKLLEESPSNNKFLQEQIKEANWFIKSLNTRHESLLKVASYVIHKQQAFLEHGEQCMQPLNLSEVARNTQLHESTISRITTNKFIQTPKGVFELKDLFSKTIVNSQGQEHSATAVKAYIKEIIMNEAPAKPISDQNIATSLNDKKGIKINRRTVAKYRDLLGIPASHLRKSTK